MNNNKEGKRAVKFDIIFTAFRRNPRSFNMFCFLGCKNFLHIVLLFTSLMYLFGRHLTYFLLLSNFKKTMELLHFYICVNKSIMP